MCRSRVARSRFNSCWCVCRSVCRSVMQCVAVCCRALHSRGLHICSCTCVCRSVFQCVALRCRALQCVAVGCRALQWVAVLLQCVAVHCSVLQCVALRCNMPHNSRTTTNSISIALKTHISMYSAVHLTHLLLFEPKLRKDKPKMV